jgi:ATP synthase protein I
LLDTFSNREDAIKVRKNNRNPFQAYVLMTAIVSQLVGSILFGIFLGGWLDKHWATGPIFLIIGLFIGLGAGTYAMVLSIRHFFSGE